MRLLLFSLFILGSVQGFAQSAKKLNKQLRTELVAEQEKQDRAYQKFVKEWAFLEQVRKQFDDTVKLALKVEDKKFRKLHLDISQLIGTLNELEINASDAYSGDGGFESHPDYKTLIKSLEEALNKPVKFRFVPGGVQKLEDQKPKQQNESLKELIKTFRMYEQYNLGYLEDLRDYIRQIEAFQPRVDSLLRVYRWKNSDLERQVNLLKQKIEAARENYRLKGPKGFPEGYQRVFPDVHRVIREVHSRESDAETGDHDASPIAWEPKEVPVMEELDLRVYEYVDEVADFPGGMTAFKQYKDEKLLYPPAAKEQGISGKVYLKFVVSDQGVISDVEVIKGISGCPECDTEAKRFVKSMPDWIPARKDGKNVHSYYNLPVIFKP